MIHLLTHMEAYVKLGDRSLSNAPSILFFSLHKMLAHTFSLNIISVFLPHTHPKPCARQSTQFEKHVFLHIRLTKMCTLVNTLVWFPTLGGLWTHDFFFKKKHDLLFPLVDTGQSCWCGCVCENAHVGSVHVCFDEYFGSTTAQVHIIVIHKCKRHNLKIS